VSKDRFNAVPQNR